MVVKHLCVSVYVILHGGLTVCGLIKTHVIIISPTHSLFLVLIT